MIRRLLLCASALAACGGSGGGATPGGARPEADAGVDATAPVVSLRGELHVHESAGTTHPWASFIAEALPLTAAADDAIVDLEPTPALVAGPCSMIVTPVCSPWCGAGTYCKTDGACAPIPQVTYVDAGDLTVRFDPGSPPVVLSFDPNGSGLYQSTPPAFAMELLRAGATIEVRGGVAERAFAASLDTPAPVAVTMPDFGQDLALPTSGPLPLAWTPSDTGLIVATVFASADSGRTATIRCSTGDTGALTVPAELVEALPPPPRSTRLEIEREVRRIVPTAERGMGVLVHVAQSTWKNGRDG